MKENREIPEMTGCKETAEFWDHNSLADYRDQTEPADFEISPYLEKRAKRARGEGFSTVLSQVPDVPPEDYDRL